VKRFLCEIDKPLRYIDHEVNATHKSFDSARVRFCFIYPDVYEIGISHLGIKILYSILNRYPQYMADRAYTPWPDMGEKLLSHGIPLSSIESNVPLRHFDCLGFTLQTELIYTNILYTLDLAKIPLCARDRQSGDPIIIAGGINAVNPHPLSRFIDAFFIGEAEQGIVSIAQIFATESKRENRLKALAELPFVYVPAYSGAKTIYAQKYYEFSESTDTHFPQIVPMLEGTHNRYTAEIMRGCYRGCRFCQAGTFYRPVREKAPNIVISQLLEDVRQSGWESAGLLSLSSTDYTCIKPLLKHLTQALQDTGTCLALPSLRVDTLDSDMASLIQEIQKSGITLAPEAGTQRLRDIINKNLTEGEILDAVQSAYTASAKLIKLYFMVGLPYETDDDIAGIVTLIEKIVTITHKKMRINVSISPFVPKPMTPFMWHGMESESEILDKVLQIKHALYRFKQVKVNYHTIESSYLEAVLGRGDSDVGLLIETAYRHGAMFDGWREYFSYQIWQEAATEIGFDWYKPIRGYPISEKLPWDNINIGIDKEYLLREYLKAQSAETTPDCRVNCAVCGINCQQMVDMTKKNIVEVALEPSLQTIIDEKSFKVENTTYRVFFSKVNDLKYLSHLDFLRLIHRLLKLSGLPVALSQGYNVHPKTSFCPPLSSGIEGLNEFFDVTMSRECDLQYILDSLSKTQIRDLTFSQVVPHDKNTIPMKDYDTEIVSVTFDTPVDIQSSLNTFFSGGDTIIFKEKKDGIKSVDLATVILQTSVSENTLHITKKIAGASIYDILDKVWGISRENASGLRIVREGVGAVRF